MIFYSVLSTTLKKDVAKNFGNVLFEITVKFNESKI